MDYQRWWRSSRSIEEFGERVSGAWAAEYLRTTGADPDDLVAVDPGNGFSYTFDLAGSLRGQPSPQEPRVVGAWGRSDPDLQSRDSSRMRGHPRPSRREDDRGHLIASAAGGGYDINLVPMDAAFNRGWSDEGARFRALERAAAQVPGSVFFVRLLYDDTSARPARLQVGAQIGDELHIDEFTNHSAAPRHRSALGQATAFPIDDEQIEGCIDPTTTRDALFIRGWQSGPTSLTRRERCAVAGVTGHIAESVAALILDGFDWRTLWHFTGPGRHGVDLIAIAPDDKVFAVEVKGTLVTRRIPRLSRRELVQMSAEWIDKADNPGMAELGLTSDDIYGAVMVINLADREWRAAFTADFETLHPVLEPGHVTDLSWLDVELPRAGGRRT